MILLKRDEVSSRKELKEQLRSACDIERIGYRLDLANEKRIGKAKFSEENDFQRLY